MVFLFVMVDNHEEYLYFENKTNKKVIIYLFSSNLATVKYMFTELTFNKKMHLFIIVNNFYVLILAKICHRTSN